MKVGRKVYGKDLGSSLFCVGLFEDVVIIFGFIFGFLVDFNKICYDCF